MLKNPLVPGPLHSADTFSGGDGRSSGENLCHQQANNLLVNTVDD